MDDFKTAKTLDIVVSLRMFKKPVSNVYAGAYYFIAINYLKKMVADMNNPRVVSSVLSKQWVDMVLKTIEEVYAEFLSELGVTDSEMQAKVCQGLSDLDMIVFMGRTVNDVKSSFGDIELATKVPWHGFEASLEAMSVAKTLHGKVEAIGKVGNCL